MTFAPSDDERRRLWNGLGALVFGDDIGSDVDFRISSRNGQIAIDTRPAPVSPVVANVGGYGITLPMVLIGAAVAFLVLRK